MPQTITIGINAFWQPSEGSIIAGLRGRLEGVVDVYAVDHARFTDEYAITFEPVQSMTSEQLKGAFMAALYDMGYENVEFHGIESGTRSTSIGGMGAVVDRAVSEVKDLSTRALIIAGIVLFAWLKWK